MILHANLTLSDFLVTILTTANDPDPRTDPIWYFSFSSASADPALGDPMEDSLKYDLSFFKNFIELFEL
jgi:hypothetical protein